MTPHCQPVDETNNLPNQAVNHLLFNLLQQNRPTASQLYGENACGKDAYGKDAHSKGTGHRRCHQKEMNMA